MCRSTPMKIEEVVSQQLAKSDISYSTFVISISVIYNIIPLMFNFFSARSGLLHKQIEYMAGVQPKLTVNEHLSLIIWKEQSPFNLLFAEMYIKIEFIYLPIYQITQYRREINEMTVGLRF